jgi:glycosyltransferase involved in cell wall biosynthesis
MTSQYPLVRVLLATYNGQRFLKEQITSIQSQKSVRVEIDVLDDGSTDGSLEILEEYLRQGTINVLSRAQGLGASFAFKMLLEAAKDSDFFAFSDQDDIWLPNKLSSQIILMKSDIPSLVISKRSFIDSNGVPIPEPRKQYFQTSFNNAMVQNIAYGNTQVMNMKLRDVVLKHRYESKHFDAWIYLLASAYGSVSLVDEPLVKYRIHESNAVGLGKKNFYHFKTIIRDSIDICTSLSNQSSELTLEKSILLGEYLRIFKEENLLRRIKLSFFSRIRRQSKMQTLIWKIAIAFMQFDDEY